LIRNQSIKIVATTYHILKLKCTSAPLAGFKGTTSKGREGKDGRKEMVTDGRVEK